MNDFYQRLFLQVLYSMPDGFEIGPLRKAYQRKLAEATFDGSFSSGP